MSSSESPRTVDGLPPEGGSSPPPPEGGSSLPPPTADPAPPQAPTKAVPRTRIGAAWVGLCTLAVVSIALIAFLLQNTRRVQVTFLWMHGTLPLALGLLIAAVGGVLITLVLGTARITQLRRLARRERATRSGPQA